MTKLFTRLWKDESGQGMVEYGLILAGIALVVMLAIGPLADAIKGIFSGAKDKLVTPTE
jgi:pilus assembly protein Flp/PilA